MIPRSMLAKVLGDIRPHFPATDRELATHIISGLYREMRQEKTPKPVLLLAACEVLGSHLTEKKKNLTINAGSIYGESGFYIDIDGPTKIEGALPDALIEFADQFVIAQTEQDLRNI